MVCMVLHGIGWYCMVLDGIAWYCMVLHGIALQYWGGVGAVGIEGPPRAKLIVPCTWLDPVIVPPKKLSNSNSNSNSATQK